MPRQIDDAEMLRAALIGYQHQLAEIDAKMADIRRRLGSRAEPAAVPAPSRPKRVLSPAARRRIAEAQKKRWAAVRGQEKATAAKTPATPANPIKKRRISAAGKKRIAEAAKRRWAAVRAKKAAPAKTAAKRTAPKPAAKRSPASQ